VSLRHWCSLPLLQESLTDAPADITDVGGTPYSLLRPILMRLDSPKHLRLLEEASPHLREDDAECWVRFINRDFSALAREHRFEPRDPTKWHRIYNKYEKLDAEQKRAGMEKLKLAMAGIKQEKESHTSTVVNFDRRKLPRPPTDVKTHGRKEAVGRRGVTNDHGELRFTGGSRTKVNNAQSIMRKARREAKEISARNRLNTPSGALLVRDNQIKRAPQGMVNAKIIKNLPDRKVHPPTTMRRTVEDSEIQRRLKEREDRLRKLKKTGTVNIVSDSDLDEDDDYDDNHGDLEDDYDEPVRARGGGHLNATDLEDMFGEEDEEPPKHSRMGYRPLKPTRSGILAGSKRPSSAIKRVTSSTTTSSGPPRPMAKGSPQSSPPLGPSSPPLKHSTSASRLGPGSPDLKPLPPKRKLPSGTSSVFMAKKPRRT
jgi:elongin-A